jgi:hypothetical protein
MNKADKFIKVIKKFQCAPSENMDSVLKCIKENQRITFFSWKMFKPDSYIFDTSEADRFINKEKAFIKALVDLKIKFDYIKLIPDELPKIFYNQSFDKDTKVFFTQVSKYFKSIYSPTKIIQITTILYDDRLNRLYLKVFSVSIKIKIDPDKFEKEVNIRENKYLALKAFGLFAAETAIILKYFKNPVLLAGRRSIDTYKYEFFKYPKNRPVLPKLFVL